MSIVVVTGASSGIGRATALRLARGGATVVLAARRADLLAEVAAETGGIAVPTDVRSPDDLAALVDKAAALGRIDGLVNNAGIGTHASVLTEDATVEAAVAVNLLAPIRLMRLVVPIMQAQEGGGVIVNIGSVAGEIGLGGAYSATKFGLRGMTDSVRRELAGTGVRVSLIEPGFIATDLTRNRRGLPGPEIVAAAVERTLRRPRRRIVVPRYYRAAITLANALPPLADRILAGRAARR